MIMSLCSDKSSDPSAAGVSTLALALAALWPSERLLLEADPSGGDALFRLTRAEGGLLYPEPTLLSLAADARAGLDPATLPDYAQPTRPGVAVIVAPPTVAAMAPTARLWPAITTAATAWTGTVLADLGRLYPGHPAAAALLPASSLVLLVTRADVAGLYRLRERVTELAAQLAPAEHGETRLLVVPRVPAARRREAAAQVGELLGALGSPALVAEVIPDDPKSAAALSRGLVGRRERRRPLARAVDTLIATIGPATVTQPSAVPDASVVAAAEGRTG